MLLSNYKDRFKYVTKILFKKKKCKMGMERLQKSLFFILTIVFVLFYNVLIHAQTEEWRDTISSHGYGLGMLSLKNGNSIQLVWGNSPTRRVIERNTNGEIVRSKELSNIEGQGWFCIEEMNNGNYLIVGSYGRYYELGRNFNRFNYLGNVFNKTGIKTIIYKKATKKGNHIFWCKYEQDGTWFFMEANVYVKNGKIFNRVNNLTKERIAMTFSGNNLKAEIFGENSSSGLNKNIVNITDLNSGLVREIRYSDKDLRLKKLFYDGENRLCILATENILDEVGNRTVLLKLDSDSKEFSTTYFDEHDNSGNPFLYNVAVGEDKFVLYGNKYDGEGNSVLYMICLNNLHEILWDYIIEDPSHSTRLHSVIINKYHTDEVYISCSTSQPSYTVRTSSALIKLCNSSVKY